MRCILKTSFLPQIDVFYMFVRFQTRKLIKVGALGGICKIRLTLQLESSMTPDGFRPFWDKNIDMKLFGSVTIYWLI